jgi:predicted nucleotidyltransferase
MSDSAKLSAIEALITILQTQPELEFAVLIGSRATDGASLESDWDIALQWSPTLDWLAKLGYTETLRRQLAQAVGVAETHIDLIDLPRSNLAMRASAAEEGKPLIGEDSLAWARFLQRTWREIEDFYWDKLYAA